MKRTTIDGYKLTYTRRILVCLQYMCTYFFFFFYPRITTTAGLRLYVLINYIASCGNDDDCCTTHTEHLAAYVQMLVYCRNSIHHPELWLLDQGRDCHYTRTHTLPIELCLDYRYPWTLERSWYFPRGFRLYSARVYHSSVLYRTRRLTSF